MTDIEIAQKNVMVPVTEVAAKINIPADKLELYGPYKAKLTFDELRALQEKAAKAPGKLILVTAVTPTPAGEGKSTVSIGLADGLNRIGKKTVVALREPSLGPCFGVKGGACGGGYAVFRGKAQFLVSGLDGASAAVLGASAIGWEIQ